MMNYPEAAITIDGLTVLRGGKTVLPSISLEIPRGRVVGLLGPSGSGKTTLMRAIVGVQKVSSGTITVLGTRAGAASLRRKIGYVTQTASVYGDLTVTENLLYFRRVVGAPPTKVDEVIGRVGLEGQIDQVVGTLSGGEKSRTSLAVALLGDPQLLVLDEPTVGLDPVLRRELWASFHSLADQGATVLVSTHVMDEARNCDRLVLMREGSIVAVGTTDELLTRTHTTELEDAFLELATT